MTTPFKKYLTYDLETGGLKSKYNSITEIAMVIVNGNTLEIEDEFSIMIKPYFNLQSREEDPIKEAKLIYRMLAEKDPDTKMNILKYKGGNITLKNLEPLVEDITKFYKILDKDFKNRALSLSEMDNFIGTEFESISRVYFDKCYNPGALQATKISEEMLRENGIPFEEAFTKTKEFIVKHTVGNSRPVRCGHNIKGFDDDFFEIFFNLFKVDMRKMFSTLVIDTLEEARKKWYEMPSYALGVCCDKVGITLKGAHRAINDTIANAKFLIKLLQALRGDGSKKEDYKRKTFDFNF